MGMGYSVERGRGAKPQGEPRWECDTDERGRECEAAGRARAGLIRVLDYNSGC